VLRGASVFLGVCLCACFGGFKFFIFDGDVLFAMSDAKICPVFSLKRG